MLTFLVLVSADLKGLQAGFEQVLCNISLHFLSSRARVTVSL
jgi:hypothetical protein